MRLAPTAALPLMASTNFEAMFAEVKWQAHQPWRRIDPGRRRGSMWATRMSERERLPLAVLVAVFSLLMCVGGGIAVSEGEVVIGLVGSVLILLGVRGLAQAGTSALGRLTPRGTGDEEERDARRD